MMKKCIIIIGSIVLLLVVLLIGVIYNNKKNAEIQEQYAEYLFKNKSEFLQKLCMKNGNWKNYPLSKEFLFKYNEKDGIFGDMQFDKVEVFPYRENDSNTDFLSRAPHIEIIKDNDLIVYMYKLKTHGTFSKPPYYPILDDVELTEPVYMTPNTQGEYDFKMPFNASYKIENLNILTSNDVGYLNAIAMTDNFKNKYPHFLDLFIHYSPLSFNKIKFIGEESDLDNNIAIFEVDSILECKKRKYRVKLILDDKLYLDDAEVELMEEKEYAGSSQNRTAKVFFKNSNWNGLKLSSRFIDKYSSRMTTFDKIELIDESIELQESIIQTNKSYIVLMTYKDGTIHAYIRTLYKNDNDMLDEITYEEIEYDREDIKALANKYKD